MPVSMMATSALTRESLPVTEFGARRARADAPDAGRNALGRVAGRAHMALGAVGLDHAVEADLLVWHDRPDRWISGDALGLAGGQSGREAAHRVGVDAVDARDAVPGRQLADVALDA